MKRTLVLFILAVLIVSASGCKRRKASCAAYDQVVVEERTH